MVSSIILGVAQSKTPLEKPKITLPRFRIHQFLSIDINELRIKTKLKIITLIRLPLPTKTPPQMDPRVTPTTEFVDTKVLQPIRELVANMSGQVTC